MFNDFHPYSLGRNICVKIGQKNPQMPFGNGKKWLLRMVR